MSQQTTSVPLIPRSVLLGNPTFASPSISPLANRLAYLAPSKDKQVLNVFVRELNGENLEDRQVTKDMHRGIRQFFWTKNNDRLLYMQDNGGDENFHVFLVDVQSNLVRDLTAFQGVKASQVLLDKNHPNEILVGLNIRDKTCFDMYRIDLNTGAVVLDTENPGNVSTWYVNAQFQIVACVAVDSQTSDNLFRSKTSSGWKTLVTLPWDENGSIDGISATGSIYITSSLGSDTVKLIEIDAETGEQIGNVIAQDTKCDVSRAILNPNTRVLEAVNVNYIKNEWKVLSNTVAKEFDFLAKFDPLSSFSVISRDAKDETWVVSIDTPNAGSHYYVFTRSDLGMKFLFSTRPDLAQFKLAQVQTPVIPTRDGLNMVSYLTLPVDVEAKNLPTVMVVHGGPWARDSYGFDPYAQLFANRGFAVLQINFRGSSGFGKSFLNAGNKQWGAKMQDDVTDAVEWAIAQGIADPSKIAIFGGSYGGYAVLAGLTFTPNLFCCGVDIVGPSHLKTLLQSIPPYWKVFKRELQLRVGDVEVDDDLNRACSPLYHVEKIVKPLMIAQGANDPRVVKAESDQIVQAMRAKQLDVQYLLFPDEGHGFARHVNRLNFVQHAEHFLAKYLGGRTESITTIEGSTLQFV